MKARAPKRAGGGPPGVKNLGETAQQWPTPDANVFADGHNCTAEEWEARRRRLKENCPTPNGNGCGTPLAMAAQLFGQSDRWATPQARDCGERGSQAKRHADPARKSAMNLDDQTAAMWPAPHGFCATDHTGKAGAGGEFAALVSQWQPTPGANQAFHCSRPAPSAPSGRPLSPDGPGSPPPSPPRKRLNPYFVEWLMNLPLGWSLPGAGWTDSGRWATLSAHSLRRLLGAYFAPGSQAREAPGLFDGLE
jgi:hypothetical protein